MFVKYTSKSDQYFTRGKIYEIIDEGIHWDTKKYVYWLTCDDYDGTDIDYCVAVTKTELKYEFTKIHDLYI